MSDLHPVFQQALAAWMPPAQAAQPPSPATQKALDWHKRNDAVAMKLQQQEKAP